MFTSFAGRALSGADRLVRGARGNTLVIPTSMSPVERHSDMGSLRVSWYSKRRGILTSAQRRASIKCASAYRTVSYEARSIVAHTPIINLLALERLEAFDARRERVPGGEDRRPGTAREPPCSPMDAEDRKLGSACGQQTRWTGELIPVVCPCISLWVMFWKCFLYVLTLCLRKLTSPCCKVKYVLF